MDGWMRSWWWLSTYYMWQRTAGSKWCSEAGDLLGKGIYSKFHSNCWDSKSWFPISQLTATWKKKSIGRRRQFFSLDFPRIALWEIKTAIFRWMVSSKLKPFISTSLYFDSVLPVIHSTVIIFARLGNLLGQTIFSELNIYRMKERAKWSTSHTSRHLHCCKGLSQQLIEEFHFNNPK